MKRSIIVTFISRVLVALSSLAVLILTSRWLGAEVRGTISLLVLALTITILIHEIIGGPAIVYFAPRARRRSIMFPALLWALATSVVIPIILASTGVLQKEFLIWLFVAALFQSCSGIFMWMLVGTEHSFEYNLTAIIQAVMTPLILAIFYSLEMLQDIRSWMIAYLVSQGLTLIISMTLFLNTKNKEQGESISFISIFRKGFLAQLSTLAFILAIRLSYYFLDKFETREELGIFSTGVTIMETSLLFSSSVALMTYARISNSTDEAYNLRIVRLLSRITMMITIPALVLILLIPDELFVSILGNGFTGIRKGMVYLFPGLAVLSFGTVITHYFSGRGMYHINAISSVIALIITLVVGYFLIPKYGIKGAAATTSLGYICSCLYTLYMFRHETKQKLVFLPDKSEVRLLVAEIKKAFS